MTSAEEYAQFARALLPASMAEEWIRLLRPAVQFPEGEAAGDRPGLRLGGDPRLPDDVVWPAFDTYGPLSFIAELDCAAVAAVGGVPDLLPESGHLLFFLVDDRYEGPDKDFDYEWRLTEWNQARVMYVPEGMPRVPRTAPECLEPYESDSRPARAVSTPPNVAWEFGDRAEEFGAGIYAMRKTYSQCGGHSRPCQGPTEVKAAMAAIDAGWSEHIHVLDEATRWRVLLQMPEAHELGMDWGAEPVAYWMIREDDLAARRFDRVWFTMQN